MSEDCHESGIKLARPSGDELVRDRLDRMYYRVPPEPKFKRVRQPFSLKRFFCAVWGHRYWSKTWMLWQDEVGREHRSTQELPNTFCMRCGAILMEDVK